MYLRPFFKLIAQLRPFFEFFRHTPFFQIITAVKSLVLDIRPFFELIQIIRKKGVCQVLLRVKMRYALFPNHERQKSDKFGQNVDSRPFLVSNGYELGHKMDTIL